MNALPYIFPVSALILSSLWLGWQHNSINSIEKENLDLTKEITQSRLAFGAENDHSDVKNDASQFIEWKKIVVNLGSIAESPQPRDMMYFLRLQHLMLEMSEADLIAAFEHIHHLNLSESSEEELASMLLYALAKKNPELALTNFVTKFDIQSFSQTGQFKSAFGVWLKSDAAAATAWFDHQLSLKTFESKALDGKNPTRDSLQSAIIFSLIASDPSAALRRMNDMPIDLRKEMLSNASQRVEGKDQKAFADIVRSSLPQEYHAAIFANQVRGLTRDQDLTKVSAYMSRIEPSPEVGFACLERVATDRFRNRYEKRAVSREDFDQFRALAQSHAPAQVAQLSVTALDSYFTFGKETSFDEAASIASDYHAAGDGDDILLLVLRHPMAKTSSSRQAARELARKLSNEKTRAQILQELQ